MSIVILAENPQSGSAILGITVDGKRQTVPATRVSVNRRTATYRTGGKAPQTFKVSVKA